MKISAWRPQLKAWLSKYLVVSKWEIDYPLTITEVLGMLPPLSSVSYQKLNDGYYGEATQAIDIIQRMGNELTYDDLPHNVLHGVYATLCIRLLAEYQDIDSDITALVILESDPITVTERDDARGDWFILTKWLLRFQWLAEIELGTLGKTYDFNEVNVGLNRGRLFAEPFKTDLIKLPINKVFDQNIKVT